MAEIGRTRAGDERTKSTRSNPSLSRSANDRFLKPNGRSLKYRHQFKSPRGHGSH